MYEKIRTEINARYSLGYSSTDDRTDRPERTSSFSRSKYTMYESTVTPTDTAPAKLDSLLALADAALYRAKRGGRNRTELAAPDMAGDACAVRLPESRTVVPGLRRTQPEQ